MKLVSMVEYILNLKTSLNKEKTLDVWTWKDSVIEYAKFLKQPLRLEMFVPCDDEGKELKGKPLSPASDGEWDRWEKEKDIYKKAVDKVVFKKVDKKSINKHGSFSLEVNGLQVAYYKGSPQYWVGLDKTIEDLVGLGIELNKYRL